MKFIKLTNGFKLNLHINVDSIESIWEEDNGGGVETYVRYIDGHSVCVKETPEEIMEMINGTVENKPEITDDDLREMMKDPKYWRDQEPEYVRKIENGFKKLYGGK